MIKGILASKIIARYSIMMALQAANQELREAARAGKIPVIAGAAAGGVLGFAIYGIIGALIGGAAGAVVIHSYKKK